MNDFDKFRNKPPRDNKPRFNGREINTNMGRSLQDIPNNGGNNNPKKEVVERIVQVPVFVEKQKEKSKFSRGMEALGEKIRQHRGLRDWQYTNESFANNLIRNSKGIAAVAMGTHLPEFVKDVASGNNLVLSTLKLAGKTAATSAPWVMMAAPYTKIRQWTADAKRKDSDYIAFRQAQTKLLADHNMLVNQPRNNNMIPVNPISLNDHRFAMPRVENTEFSEKKTPSLYKLLADFSVPEDIIKNKKLQDFYSAIKTTKYGKYVKGGVKEVSTSAIPAVAATVGSVIQSKLDNTPILSEYARRNTKAGDYSEYEYRDLIMELKKYMDDEDEYYIHLDRILDRIPEYDQDEFLDHVNRDFSDGDLSLAGFFGSVLQKLKNKKNKGVLGDIAESVLEAGTSEDGQNWIKDAAGNLIQDAKKLAKRNMIYNAGAGVVNAIGNTIQGQRDEAHRLDIN